MENYLKNMSFFAKKNSEKHKKSSKIRSKTLII